MDRSRPALALALAFAALAAMLGGCAHSGALRCGAGSRAMVQERLYFGTQRPGGTVSDAEWRAFVDEVVAATFPGGFTGWDAMGGWRGADGRPVREASHVLEVVHPAGAAMDAALASVAAAYNARFEQEAVMRVRVPACVAFEAP
jgi:hypothetical protein